MERKVNDSNFANDELSISKRGADVFLLNI